jgi:hypothetical protein
MKKHPKRPPSPKPRKLTKKRLARYERLGRESAEALRRLGINMKI